MAVKAPRALTHAKRLYAPERWAEILERGLRLLGDRAGPLLLQLPPTMERDDARLAYALGHLPAGVRTAVEFRHPSWLDDAVFDLLARHRAAYVVMSGAQLPCVLRATSDLVYVRWHGPSGEHLYAGSYSDDDLRWWADRLLEWEGPATACTATSTTTSSGTRRRTRCGCASSSVGEPATAVAGRPVGARRPAEPRLAGMPVTPVASSATRPPRPDCPPRARSTRRSRRCCSTSTAP